MQIVIEVPKEEYEYLKTGHAKEVFYGDAIAKGIPLPEHHSDLIERSSLNVDNLDRAYGPNCELDFGRLYIQDVIEMIEKAPIIIPATKEKSCEDCANWNEHYGTIDCMECQNRDLWKSKQNEGR